MKTKYLTSLTTTLSPFSPHAKTPRLILSLLPADARTRIAIKTTLLPRAAALTQPATLEMAFKDGRVMKWTWSPRVRGKVGGEAEMGTAKQQRQRPEEAKVADVVEEVERHYRGLVRVEELAG
jgi:large subunit ribosomal protein L53